MAASKTPRPNPTDKSASDPLSFPVVGIGASAGGFEALRLFFLNTPIKSGIAYVVIQHLDPNYKGILPELLQRVSALKVIQASDRLRVQKDHVYVIPPNKSISILNGFLYLFEPIEKRGLQLPIDYFFKSLAEDQKNRSIGVILSGMGSDGSLGLKAIKEKGGIAVVQEPADAKFDGMPKSALKAVNVDILGPAAELPAKLNKWIEKGSEADSAEAVNRKNKRSLEKIILLLRSQTGHDFSLYKETSLSRRVERRMQVHQIINISTYIRFLQENPNEIELLFNELLIGVTSFFRDENLWKELKENVLPDFMNKHPDNYTIRAWLTGVSTGEEAYSLAIILKELCDELEPNKSFSIQIFATDIDSIAIEKARKGVFSQKSMEDVSLERIDKFFIREEESFRVKSTIREMIVFAPHDVIKDPPFTRQDILFCRNMLIYMQPELQRKLMNLFFYSLKKDGIMVLGSAENENSEHQQFETIDSKMKIYRRKQKDLSQRVLDLPSSFSNTSKSTSSQIRTMKSTDNIQTLADQIILQRFSPASVLVNQDGDILYITGRTGKYLEPAAGKANWNIYAMAREGLRNELPAAIRRAKQKFEAEKLTQIRIGSNGGANLVDVTFQQLEQPESLKGTIMIVFSDVPVTQAPQPGKTRKGSKNATAREQELETELLQAREQLQSLREEMHTTQEELKSTNEEMQSTNEELQSTNEELTTSKEEMQSLNEELQTVNAELQSKLSDLIEVNNDMKNLLNSTDIATLFLDRKLNIRRFTDKLTKLYKLRQTDIGRPFTDMVSSMLYPDMVNDAMEVLRTLVFKEKAIETKEGYWYNVRIMAYRTYDDHIDGLVITFIDITSAHKVEDKLNKAISILHEHKLDLP